MLDATRRGGHRATAAAMAGISKETLYKALAWGRHYAEQEDAGRRLTRGERQLAEFADAMQRQTGAAELYAVDTILGEVAKGNWVAAMTYLERRFPDRWARRQVIRHEGDDDQAAANTEGLTLVLVGDDNELDAAASSSGEAAAVDPPTFETTAEADA